MLMRKQTLLQGGFVWWLCGTGRGRREDKEVFYLLSTDSLPRWLQGSGLDGLSQDSRTPRSSTWVSGSQLLGPSSAAIPSWIGSRVLVLQLALWSGLLAELRVEGVQSSLLPGRRRELAVSDGIKPHPWDWGCNWVLLTPLESNAFVFIL